MGTVDMDALRANARGEVVAPSDPSYDEARRVFNAMIDRRPAAIVRPIDTDDVRIAVAAAAAADVPVAIRGGGHSVPGFGTADDAIVIDLSAMRRVDVDPGARTTRAQGGATWGDLNEATNAFGLATTGGIVSTTGVGGLTLGGGIGYLARRAGLSIDNLLSAEVVTADGGVVTASEREHEDLFWALRGGGGNFGVVTAFEFSLHPVSEIYGGPMFFELEAGADLLRFYRDFIADAPEAFGGFPAFQIAPPLPFIPEDRHGDTLMVFVSCWSGPIEDAEAVLEPLRDVAPIVAEHVGPMPYPALNAAFDALYPAGELRHYWKTLFSTELTDEAIDVHLEHGPRVPSLQSTVHIYPIDGACQRVESDATAFSYRDASFATVIAGMWPDPADDDANVAWVRDYFAAASPHAEAGGYVNFMSGDDQDRLRDSYRGNYDRLVDVKRAYDPDNLFRVNQNIAP